MTLHTPAERVVRLQELGYWNGNFASSITMFKMVNWLVVRPYYGPVTDALLFASTTARNTHIPAWMWPAVEMIGLQEIHGAQHNPKVLEFWRTLKLPYTTDETAWCAGYVGHCLETGGVRSTRSAAARSYALFGRRVQARFGALAVYWRGTRNGGNGHVAFVAGADRQGRVLILGGNQSDSVSIVVGDTTRLLDYRFPTVSTGLAAFLPTIALDVRTSTTET